MNYLTIDSKWFFLVKIRDEDVAFKAKENRGH